VSEARAWPGASLRAGLLLAILAAVGGFASVADAAAPTPVPGSTTNCGGSLTRATATIDDPNQLAYKFNCNYSISSYTLSVSRGLNTYTTVDDFSSGATVTDTSGNPLSDGEAFNCTGTIPGGGVNCGDAGVTAAAQNFVQGTFDTTAPYCPSIPAGSPAGTQPTPGAVVQLVVTDTTGAEDGPFRLVLADKCRVVHVVPKPKPKPQRKHHKAAKKPAAA
jgi:hypothetical protein